MMGIWKDYLDTVDNTSEEIQFGQRLKEIQDKLLSEEKAKKKNL